MRFRKKPIEIEAEQYIEYGKFVKGMCNSQSCYASGNTEPHVHTIHNNQIVILEIGDWIIPESDGVHFYPCKSDIFEMTYEKVDDKIKCFTQFKDQLVEFEFNKNDLYCPGCGKPKVLCLHDTTGCIE